jgi:hypothetical protein
MQYTIDIILRGKIMTDNNGANNKKNNTIARNHKNRTIHMDSEHKIKKSRNIWKILAIVFVALFIIIMTIGLLRVPNFREPPQQLTREQTTTIKNIALSDLTHRESIIANYTIKTQGVVREIKTNNTTRKVTEISIYNSTTMNMYIIDIITGEIIIYSKTEFFDGLDYSNDNRRINENANVKMSSGQREIMPPRP